MIQTIHSLCDDFTQAFCLPHQSVSILLAVGMWSPRLAHVFGTYVPGFQYTGFV